MPPMGDRDRNPDMCSDWDSNCDLLVHGLTLTLGHTGWAIVILQDLSKDKQKVKGEKGRINAYTSFQSKLKIHTLKFTIGLLK